MTIVSGDVITAHFTVPIVGWDAGAQLSTNEVAMKSDKFRASRNGTNQTGVAPNNSGVQILFNSFTGSGDFSTLGYDTTNSRFVAKAAGRFYFSATLNFSGTNVLANEYYAYFTKNGVDHSYGPAKWPAATNSLGLEVVSFIDLVPGDYVQVHIFGAGNNSSSTLTLKGGSSLSYFFGYQVPDLSVFSAYGDASDIELVLDTGNGHGSTNTNIRRFTNTRKNTLGTFATYADSAANGMSVTINIPGLYSITYVDSSTNAESFGLSLSTSAPTTSIVTLTYAQGKLTETSNPALGASTTSIVKRLKAGDIIRVHTNGAVAGAGVRTIFQMQRLGN